MSPVSCPGHTLCSALHTKLHAGNSSANTNSVLHSIRTQRCIFDSAMHCTASCTQATANTVYQTLLSIAHCNAKQATCSANTNTAMQVNLFSTETHTSQRVMREQSYNALQCSTKTNPLVVCNINPFCAVSHDEGQSRTQTGKEEPVMPSDNTNTHTQCNTSNTNTHTHCNTSNTKQYQYAHSLQYQAIPSHTNTHTARPSTIPSTAIPSNTKPADTLIHSPIPGTPSKQLILVLESAFRNKTARVTDKRLITAKNTSVNLVCNFLQKYV